MSLHKKLEAIRMFQQSVPDAHVGGSIGLFLQGIDMGRDFDKAGDVDMKVASEIDIERVCKPGSEIKERSNTADFAYCFDMEGVKIDCAIQPEEKFEVILYEGFEYRVSLMKTILHAKVNYALAGSKKNIDDLAYVFTKLQTSGVPNNISF